MVVFPMFGFFFLPLLFLFLALRLGSSAYRRRRWDSDRDYFETRPVWRDELQERLRGRGSRPEVRVFRLANRLGGRLTVSDVVVDMDLSIAEAEALLDQLVDNARVTMEVRDDGLVFYEFPEIIARRGGGDDFPARL